MYKCTPECTCVCACVFVCLYVCVPVSMCVCTLSVYVCIHVSVCACMCMCVSECLCVCVCIHVRMHLCTWYAPRPGGQKPHLPLLEKGSFIHHNFGYQTGLRVCRDSLATAAHLSRGNLSLQVYATQLISAWTLRLRCACTRSKCFPHRAISKPSGECFK